MGKCRISSERAIAYVTLHTSRGIRMLFDKSERGHSVRTGCTSPGVGTMFDKSGHGYSVRHGVYIRFSTNQSAFRPISAWRSRILISVAPCGGLHNLAQPQKNCSKTSYYTTYEQCYLRNSRALIGQATVFSNALAVL